MDKDGNAESPCKHPHHNIFFTPLTSFFSEPREAPGLCKRLVMGFCGLEQNQTVKLTPEEEAELKRKLTDTTEKPLWRRVVNVNALILLTVAVFCHGFFA